MASRDVSGIVALLKSFHSEWSPAAIRLAIMTTTYDRDTSFVLIKAGGSGKPANPFDFGAGHVNPLQAILDMGMGSALETLCGQAYGAKQYHLLGIHVQRAIVALFCVSIPLAVVWAYMSNILIAFGQDPLISFEAGKFARWLFPSLFAYAALQPLVNFLQSQSIVFPMMLCSAITLCFHVPICWALVFKTGLGIARGCGWQKLGAYVNLGAYYMVDIPTAVLLAFVLHVGGRGLWLGIVCGIFVQSILLFLVTSCID